MPAYKLYYFDGRGLGEISRQLFHLSGTQFEDYRVQMSEWPGHKELTPFGKLPVLIVDGKPLPQSFAIARYLAKEFGYAGKTNFEAAWVDAIGDQYKDYLTEMSAFLPVIYGFAPGDKEKLQKEVAEPARDKFFAILEKRLAESTSGHLVGDSLTWVDLVVVDHVGVLQQYIPFFLGSFPNVLNLCKKVRSCPKLKPYLEKREKTPF